jgi:hypothetical protein
MRRIIRLFLDVMRGLRIAAVVGAALPAPG